MHIWLVESSMHHRNLVLCHQPWRTAKARMADGKGLCRPPRTANSDGKDRVGKGLLCRLFFAADGKEAFAVSGGRQRARLFTICWQTAKGTALCHLLADGKGCRLFAICWQMAKRPNRH